MPTAPVAYNDGTYSVVRGQILNVPADGVLANDTGTNLTAHADPGGSAYGGYVWVNSDGSFAYYNLNPGFSGADSFTYKAYDGYEYSASATVSINVTNTAPVATGGSLSVAHDQYIASIDFNNYVTDADGDLLTFAYYGGPTHGALTPNPDGTYKYQPAPGWTGTDQFTIIGNDGFADSGPGGLTIEVTNTAPVAVADEFSLHAGLILSLDATSGLTHNDYDVNGDPLTAEQVGPDPSNSTLTFNASGAFTFQANSGFVGDAVFSYRLFDGAAYSDAVQVTIHVQNQAPQGTADSFDVWSVSGISNGSANVLANDSDRDHDAMTAVIYTNPSYADSFQLNADGTFLYVPVANPPQGWPVQDSFTYKTFDGTTYSAPVTASLFVTDSPLAKDDAYILDANGELAADGVLDNEFNPMGAGLTAELVQGIDPLVGTLVFNADGSFNFTAGASFQGDASFSYQMIYQIGNVFFPGTTATVRIFGGLIAGASVGLMTVAFDGNAVITDDNGAPYETPQWHTETGGGDAPSTARAYPISFTRNTKIPLTPTFIISPDSAFFWRSLGNNVLVRADSNIFTAAGQPLRLGNNQNIHLQLGNILLGDIQVTTLTTQGFVLMDNPLPDYTDYHSSLDLTWQISPDNGLTWIAPARLFAGQTMTNVSRNQTFVTLAGPNGWDPALVPIAGGWYALQKPAIPVTVFYVGIEGGNGGGANSNATLLTEIWSAFQTRTITNAAGTELTYWGGWNAQAVTTDGLIALHNGQCYSWASLFVDVLRAWGDTDVTIQSKKRIDTNPVVTTVGVTPVLAPQGDHFRNQFLVGNWQLGAAAAVPNPANNPAANAILRGWTNYAVFPTNANNPTVPNWFSPPADDQPGHYLWTNGPTAPATATPAQNNTDPLAAFQNHVLVLINGVLYDPSYGVTYAYDPTNESTKVAGFVAALGGLMTTIPFNNNVYNFNLNGAGATDNNSYWVALFKPITTAMIVMR